MDNAAAPPVADRVFIEAATVRETVVVDVELDDGPRRFLLREPTEADRLAILRGMPLGNTAGGADDATPADLQARVLDLLEWGAEVVAKVVVDDAGEPLMSAAQAQQLMQKYREGFRPVVERAQALMGLNAPADDEAADPENPI